MLKVTTKGSFKATTTFLKDAKDNNFFPILHKYGRRGVDLLKAHTPVDTGVTAASWRYKILETKTGYSLQWLNDATTEDGDVPIVVLIIYGHGAQNGTYVEGNNFVTPALKGMLNKLAKQLMREV